jgi:BirA family biotin operon repressor/biotin-[acetyl-CoA-carboxylase] ligase
VTRVTATHPEPHLPLGWHLKTFGELDGTNAALKRIVESGTDVAEGYTVWAASQTAGRGRGGRTWASPPGNLYISVLIPMPDAMAQAPQLGFVTALAVRDAILDLPRHNAPPPPVKLKWPNDVLVDGKKCSGILLEAVSVPAGGGDWLIIGIGLNLKPTEVSDAGYPICSLAVYGVDATPIQALNLVIRDLHMWIERWRKDGFGPIKAAWMESGPAMGENLSVRLPEGSAAGVFAGLDEDGALLLDSAGNRRRVVAGDVLHGGVAA